MQNVYYTPEQLEKVKQVALSIYKDVMALCEKHGIRQMAAYGTLLGAVRHSGFIPWDDDIDLIMLREDYDRFIEIAPESLKEKYEVQSMERTDGYVLNFAKVIKKGTLFVEESYQDRRYPTGIFIDIFVMEKVSPDEGACVKNMRKAKKWMQLAYLCEYSAPPLPSHMNVAMKTALLAACRILHPILRICGITAKRCRKAYLKLATAYQKADGIYMEYSDRHAENTIVEYGDLFPLQPHAFEDTVMYLPNHAEKILRNFYGDYMTLPPPEERRAHAPVRICFGEDE